LELKVRLGKMNVEEDACLTIIEDDDGFPIVVNCVGVLFKVGLGVT